MHLSRKVNIHKFYLCNISTGFLDLSDSREKV